MAILTPTRISKTGLADLAASLTTADAAGDQVQASGNLLIVMENNDAGAHTLTLTRPAATTYNQGYGDLALEDVTLTVAAGDIGFVSIPKKYANSNADFAWTYDGVTSVNIGVFSIAA